MIIDIKNIKRIYHGQKFKTKKEDRKTLESDFHQDFKSNLYLNCDWQLMTIFRSILYVTIKYTFKSLKKNADC